VSTLAVYTRRMPRIAKDLHAEGSPSISRTASPAPMVEFIEAHRDSSAAFAEEIGETRQTVSNWKTRGIPIAAVEKVARAMGITYDQYMAAARGQRQVSAPGVAEAPGKYVLVPAFDSIVGLGPGRFNEHHVEISGEFAYPTSWIVQNGWRIEDLAVTFGEGESMRDTIFEGDRLLVHLRENDMRKMISGQIYAIEDQYNGARVKRLFKLPDGRVLVKSDNKNGLYPDEYLTPESEARIVGRIVDRAGPPR
jgi:hypothetical protein